MSVLTDNVGAIAGVVGAIASICCAIAAYLAHKHSNTDKAINLRLELKKGLSDAHALVVSLRTLLTNANESRLRVMSATGQNGGALIIWGQALAADRAEVERLAGQLHSEQHDWSASNHKQLVSEAASIHAKKRDLGVIEEKYKAALAEDDERRKEIRQNMNDKVNQQLAAQRRDAP